MSDIFLSYASDDLGRARALAGVLEGEGYSVWWDRNIPPGKSFDQAIEQALEEARAVVVLFTESSVASRWVLSEAERALSRQILIPVLADDLLLPLAFRSIHPADLSGWSGDPGDSRLAELIHAIGLVAGPPSERDRGNDRNTDLTQSRPAFTPHHKIFISYRRRDSAYATGHLSDQLTAEFGEDEIYKDVDSMPLGADVRQHLDDAVANCRVLIAVIGRDWLDAVDDNGSRRLDDERDHLRIEIESALKRAIPVIPLLLEGVPMPEAQSLPEGLQQLAFLNASRIRPAPDFQKDVERLVRGLKDLLATRPV